MSTIPEQKEAELGEAEGGRVQPEVEATGLEVSWKGRLQATIRGLAGHQRIWSVSFSFSFKQELMHPRLALDLLCICRCPCCLVPSPSVSKCWEYRALFHTLLRTRMFTGRRSCWSVRNKGLPLLSNPISSVPLLFLGSLRTSDRVLLWVPGSPWTIH